MHGQRVGYVPVSTLDQNEERQLEQVQLDRVFTDKASGKDTRGRSSPNCCPTSGRVTLSESTA